MSIASKINIDTDIGKANLAMHIVNFNNLSREDFNAGFQSQEVIDYALGEGMDHAWGMIPDYKEVAKSTLKAMVVIPTGTTTKEARSPIVHSTSNVDTHDVFIKPRVLITNKGEFKSIEILQANIGKMYPFMDEEVIQIIVDESKLELDQEGDVQYMDEPMFTSLIKIIKIKCDEDSINQLGGASSYEVPKKTPDVVEDEVETPREDGPSIKDKPYQFISQAGITYFDDWGVALQFQKEYNKSNGTKLRAKKRIQ